MNTKKRMYRSPRYEMVKFDDEIVTENPSMYSGCWGITGNQYTAENPTECKVTEGYYSNIYFPAMRYRPA